MSETYIYIAVMAVVTYLIRVLPLTLIRREIKNVTLRSFLYYVPYASKCALPIFHISGRCIHPNSSSTPFLPATTRASILPPWNEIDDDNYPSLRPLRSLRTNHPRPNQRLSVRKHVRCHHLS